MSAKEAEHGETGSEPRRDCMQQAPTCGTARTTVKGTGSPRPRVRDKPNPRAETKQQRCEEGSRSRKVAQEQGNHKEGRGTPDSRNHMETGNKCTTLTAEQCGREYLTPIGTRVRPKCKINLRLTDNQEGRTNQPSMEEEHRK